MKQRLGQLAVVVVAWQGSAALAQTALVPLEDEPFPIILPEPMADAAPKAAEPVADAAPKAAEPAEEVPGEPVAEEVPATLPIPLVETSAPAPANLETAYATKAEAPKLPMATTIDPMPDMPSLWQTALVVGSFLAGLGTLGFLLTRLRNGKTLRPNLQRSERPMEIVHSLGLGPKRQLVLVSVRGREVLLSSTEAGICLLCDLNQPQPVAAALPMTLPSRVIEPPTRQLPVAAKEEAPRDAQKVEILRDALKNLRERKATKREEATPAPTPEEKPAPKKKEQAPFPKYLAAAFEQESKRSLQPENVAETAPKQPASDESVENITRMIRDRLRSMHADNN